MHREFDKRIRTKQVIQKPDSFEVDNKFNEYITNRRKESIFLSLKVILH